MPLVYSPGGVRRLACRLTSGLPSKPGMSVGEPILPGGPVDSPSRLVRPDQGESVGQDRFPTDGFDTTPSMLGGCDSSAPPSPPMITAGAIPALDLYRNQPVVGGYGTHDLDPNWDGHQGMNL